MGLAAVALGFAIILVPLVLRPWLWKRYQAGEMTGRAAGWIYAAAAVAPYLVLVIYIGAANVETLWIVIPLLIIALPVAIIPWVAIFRYPSDT